MRYRYLVLAAVLVAASACGKGDHAHNGDEDHAHTENEGVTAEVNDWCAEHGIAESACTKCDPTLIAKFKEAGDYCTKHGFPESQCPLCKQEEAGHSHEEVKETGPIRAN